MPDILDRIAGDQQRQLNSEVATAEHDANWANTFNSIPSAEKSRANLNFADAIARATQNKIDLAARGDIRALEFKHALAKHNEWQQQAPLREELQQAHIDATGATERRKAAEATATMQQTTNLNRGMLDIYKRAKYGTPEFQQGVVELIAENPMAHADHISEIGKMGGLGDGMSPEDYIKKAVELKKAAVDAGLSNPTVRSYSGKPIVIEGTAPVDPQALINNAVAKEKALITTRNEMKVAPVDTFEAFNKDLQAMVEAHGGAVSVPAERWKEFEDRKKKIGQKPVVVSETVKTPAGTETVVASPVIPKVGEVRNGWKFKGGNPADKSNWEK